MKINKIVLFNFGSYEGENTFSFFHDNPDQRVVVIGGKNGAGKTTLFTALQVGLYGHFAFGFRSAGKYYFKEIYNLINNKVRMDDTASAYVEISFDQVTDTEKVAFRVRRNWGWASGDLDECLEVWQDERLLDEEGLENFQKYLIHLIPPDLLKLYFFDGEKVADYFLGNCEVNIRDALMILSGNDTFDILFENVRRVLKISESQDGESAKTYLALKQKSADLQARIHDTQKEITSLTATLEDLQTSASLLTQQYASHGGVTLEEWTAMHNELKAEEEKRERISWQRKALATDVLPFMIVSDLLKRVPDQIRSEKAYTAYRTLLEQIETPEFSSMLTSSIQQLGGNQPDHAGQRLLENIKNYFYNPGWDGFEPLFGLSNDEETQVQMTLTKVIGTEPAIFKRDQRRIDASLEKTKAIRAKIQSSDIEHFEEYVKELTRLEEEQKIVCIKIEHAHESCKQFEAEYMTVTAQLRSAKRAFEDQLKKESVTAVSGRVLLLLEDLQKELYVHLLRNVERDINVKFRQLIRKEDFFTEIRIDDDFNIHILRNQAVTKADILSQMKGGALKGLKKAIGRYAVDVLQAVTGTADALTMRNFIRESDADSYTLPVEIDKDYLSSGEKQIFVMSLYWAMMQQSKNSLPYVIDTPFARIDTEHRVNITNYFFKQLDGQLIILSTDEEITDAHMSSMKEQIARVYMLEYGQDKSTHIYENIYF